MKEAKNKFYMGPIATQAVKITLFGAIFWFSWSFGTYQSVYLQKVGFSASQLGMLNAIGSAISIFAVAFWGMISDKIGSIKRTLIFVFLFGMGFYALVPLIPTGLPYSTLLFMTMIPALNFVRGAIIPLVDNIQVRTSNLLRLNFGTIRSFGSIFFTIGSLIISTILPFVSLSSTFWLSFVLSIPAFILLFFLHEPRRQTTNMKKEKVKLDIKPLLKNKSYLFFLAFASLYFIASSCDNTFIPYFMTDIGIPSEKYGYLLAYRAFLEAPLLILMARLKRKIKLEYLILIGVFLISFESLGFGLFVNSLPTMLLFSTFFGLGNGLFIGSSLNYLYQMAPTNLKATAQSFYSAVAAASSILGNILGGFLFDSMSAKPFYIMTYFIYLLSLIIFALSLFLVKRKRKAEVATKQI